MLTFSLSIYKVATIKNNLSDSSIKMVMPFQNVCDIVAIELAM